MCRSMAEEKLELWYSDRVSAPPAGCARARPVTLAGRPVNGAAVPWALCGVPETGAPGGIRRMCVPERCGRGVGGRPSPKTFMPC